MAAGLGFKTFATGEVLTANDTNGYLMQGVWVFASAAARTTAVTSPQEGNASFLKDTNSFEIYDGGSWVSFGAPADKSCRAIQNAATSITTSYTSIAFQTESFDTDTIHDNSTNNSRLTIKTAGKYVVGTTVSTATNNSVWVRILLNGTTNISGIQSGGNTGSDDSRSIVTFYNFAVNDYVEAQAKMGGTGNSTGNELTNFWCVKVA